MIFKRIVLKYILGAERLWLQAR